MKLLDKILFLLLFGFLLFVGLNRHSRHPRFDYHSQIFTDKSGYHVYLPAFFYYDMDACKLPADIVEKTGRGFRLVDNKIVTKYPIGVAIMHSPFFGIAALFDHKSSTAEEYGYTENQHVALNWSTSFYTTLGLLFLWLTAVYYWQLEKRKAYLLLFMVLFVSNLLYYSTRDAGMSHAFSFFVFAALQFLIFKILNRKSISGLDGLGIILLGSLVVALRPLNALFLVFPISFILKRNWSVLKEVKFTNYWVTYLLSFVLGIAPILFQLAYNFYAYDELYARGYAAETFSNIQNLELLTFWFAPNNGVFLYIPSILLVLVWCYNSFLRKKYIPLLYLGYFLVISLTYAAWWSPTLGCGFGHRGFTEHLAFFALPISGVLGTTSDRKVKIAWVLSIVFAIYLFIWQWNFDGCWYGSSPWDWSEFIDMLDF